MRNQGMALIGALVMVAGILLLLSSLFDFNLWAVCFPLGLILLGVFVIFRPRMVGPDTKSHIAFVDEAERSGPWVLGNEEHWAFVLDGTFDLTKADIMQATGWSAPTAAYRLSKLVAEGKLETEMCMADGKRVRVWRKPG